MNLNFRQAEGGSSICIESLHLDVNSDNYGAWLRDKQSEVHTAVIGFLLIEKPYVQQFVTPREAEERQPVLSAVDVDESIQSTLQTLWKGLRGLLLQHSQDWLWYLLCTIELRVTNLTIELKDSSRQPPLVPLSLTSHDSL